jgi:CheY-like chemotaxis protein
MSEATHPYVLVVDDDESIREALSSILEDEGFNVRNASDGAEALRQLAVAPLPGLIILDLMMPVMSGWEFRAAQKADATLASIPVCVITAANIATKPIDADQVIRKPFDYEKLLDIVRVYCTADPVHASDDR